MSEIFSKEMEKAIIELFNKRYKELNIDTILDELENRINATEDKHRLLESDIEDNHDAITDVEHDLEGVTIKHEKFATNEDVGELLREVENDIENLVSKTMLKLMPSFNKRIAKEIKSHLVAISDLMKTTFKEKE